MEAPGLHGNTNAVDGLQAAEVLRNVTGLYDWVRHIYCLPARGPAALSDGAGRP